MSPLRCLAFEHPRIQGVSNLSTFKEGVCVLRTIVTERFRPAVSCDVPGEREAPTEVVT